MKPANQARITLGKEISDHTVSPYLFGHFIEDIDDHMTAMLAFPIRNMDFEEEDRNGDGVSDGWYPLGYGRHTQYALEPAARGHGGHSQKIRLFNKDRAAAGIGQRMEVTDGQAYRLKVIVRATREIIKLHIKLTDRSSGELIGSTELDVRSHQWASLEGEVISSRSCRNAELQIWATPLPAGEWEDSVSTGMVWFDHISLLPERMTALLKQEVYEMTRDLNCGIMRLGGNYISLYHWEDFVGPAVLRPNYINEAWENAGHVHKYFGTDEFIDLCRQLGVEPQICVNMGTGTPEEAARWVEYCNGAIDTPMGAARAANGHPEPYGVRYWEVGNEMYGSWQAGVCTPEQYAEKFIRFASAMKEKDPAIKLLGCGTARESLVPGWNRKVLELAGAQMDYLTFHMYQGKNFFKVDAGTPGAERFQAIVAFAEVAGSIFGEAEAMIRSRDELNHVKLAVTEWNTMYFPNPDLPNAHTLEAAIANASLLNEMMRRSDLVEIANFSDLVNGWVGGCIRVGDSYERMKKPGWSGQGEGVFGTATYHLLKMYAGRSSHRLVAAEVECDTFNAGPCLLPLRLEHLSKLDVVSTISENTETLNVFIVNRSLDALSLVCDLSSWKPEGAAVVHELAGQDYELCNTIGQPDLLREKVREVQLDGFIWKAELRPHSVYVLELSLNRDPAIRSASNRIG